MPMIIRRADKRGHVDHRWLNTHHTFSFADYYDAHWMGFKTLRVINEDRIKPGKGFDLHGHRDMEILTYVMHGALRHVDTAGNNEVLKAGEFQRMTAGSGIQHIELNASQTEDCHLYQIWILPDQANLEPGYEQKSFAERLVKEKKILIASPDAQDGSLKIHQDAEVWLYRLEVGEAVKIELALGKACWLQVVSGEIGIGTESLHTSDAAAFDQSIEMKAASASELMLFVL